MKAEELPIISAFLLTLDPLQSLQAVPQPSTTKSNNSSHATGTDDTGHLIAQFPNRRR